MIRLSQTAPWNARLGNPYRTRWTQAGDRYFRVSAEHLTDLWTIEEVDTEGHPLTIRRPGPGEDATDSTNWEFGFSAWALTLAAARNIIAAECGTEE